MDLIRRRRVRRLLVGVCTFAAVNVGAFFLGQALHPRHAAAAAVACPAVSTGGSGGRDRVGFADATGNAGMSTAIDGAVARWNAAGTDVVLVRTRRDPGIVFRSGAVTLPVARCRTSAPRRVVVTLGRLEWTATAGRRAVRDPVAAVGKVVGLALGLHSSGHCPSLMAPAACAHRSSAPDPTEVAAVDRLYPSGR